MRTVDLLIDVPDKSAEEVYAALADLARYPDLADAVKSVTVTPVAENITRSEWEVAFRAGLLRWTEEDRFDAADLTIGFRQTEGDIALFDGRWRCMGTSTGAEIVFSARLDMGIPSLADALEPIAARTLVENTVAIVGGLMGEAHLVESRVGVPAEAAS